MFRNTRSLIGRLLGYYLLGLPLITAVGMSYKALTVPVDGVDQRIGFIGLAIFGPSFGGLLIWLSLRIGSRRVPTKQGEAVRALAARYLKPSIVGLIVGIVIMAGSSLATPEVANRLQQSYDSYRAITGPASTVLGTAILALFGYGLFVLKNKALLVYAYGEITFALTSCYVAIQKATHEAGFGTVTVVIASTYLVVRGLDNRKKAVEAVSP